MTGEAFQEELARRRALELAARRILGVPPTAGPEKIRLAFRRLAPALHPDRRPEDPEATGKFVRLVAAYRLLMDGTEPSVPLGESDKEEEIVQAGKYQETAWGYYAWWRESFIQNELEDQKEGRGHARKPPGRPHRGPRRVPGSRHS